MDTAEILNKLKQAVPGALLEKNRFGRSAHLSLWIETRLLANVAAFLKNEPQIALDWLENLSAIQMDDALVVTYFLRSSSRDHTLILRGSIVPGTQSKEVSLPSVVSVWRMAEPMEVEIQELFGIRFIQADGKSAHESDQRLPKNWNGYPLRKNYVFPTEFLGISHTRIEGKLRND